ncbi:unnamed protein product [Orchesella dallaii]|uniref:Tyrosine specific protein phosphatases domain-containing protein n=1 Tax=Orchesella dallaii TaxID=48710 RepID=A0ABP1RBC1_9HEXA
MQQQQQQKSARRVRTSSVIIVPGACTEISYKGRRFLITQMPNNNIMDSYIQELIRYKVHTFVRVCKLTYSPEKLANNGIKCVDLSFHDGLAPPQDVIDTWFNLVRTQFKEDPESCTAVQCAAGLGRAPILVALSLMELGMKYEDAVEHIRQKRHGAINAKQLTYLERYKPNSRLKIEKFENYIQFCGLKVHVPKRVMLFIDNALKVLRIQGHTETSQLKSS